MPTEPSMPATTPPECAALAPLPLPEEPALPALLASALPPTLLAEDQAAQPICIIPGSGVPSGPLLPPKSRRRWGVQGFVAAVVLGGLLAALFSFAPLTEAATHEASPLNALANILLIPTPRVYFAYHVQFGDTYASIAAHFGVALGGIYQLNQIQAGQTAQVGQILHIPIDPKLGMNYQLPALPQSSAGTGTGLTNFVGNCLFCSAGGWTNGPNQPCATAGLSNPIMPAHFALLNPEPGSHWVRGFTWDHNGVDISSGVFGTPILAAQAGVVIYASWDPYGGGYAVKINHCGGMATAYAHMERLLVTVGQAVQAGQPLGLQGATGNATGPHLHFMTWWNNVPFDPLCVFPTLDGISATQHYGGCPAPQNSPDGVAPVAPTPVGPTP